MRHACPVGQAVKGDRVEIVIDAGGTSRTYEVTATRAGRRVEVVTGRGVVEVMEVTRGGTVVRTARFMANRVLALVEHPAADKGTSDKGMADRGAAGRRPALGRLNRTYWPDRPTVVPEGEAMPGRPLTVLFMPESAYGPTNNCIGIGDVLRRRGHRVVFAAEASWKGRLEPLGFEEDLVDLSPPREGEQDAGAFWKEFIASTAPEFRKPTIEQLDTWIKPVWAELISGARYGQEQLAEIVARTRPDVIVEDNVISFPALLTAGVPFVRIVSCNPLEVADPALPPAFSGYPAGDQARWPEFRAEYDRVHRADVGGVQ